MDFTISRIPSTARHCTGRGHILYETGQDSGLRLSATPRILPLEAGKRRLTRLTSAL